MAGAYLSVMLALTQSEWSWRSAAGHSTCAVHRACAFVVHWNRGLRNWKKSTLADFAGVSVSTIERIERGEKVSDEVLDKVAEGLGYEAGFFTKLRFRLGTDEAAAKLADTYGHLEPVAVAPLKTHRAIRQIAQSDAYLFHRPDVPESYDGAIANLGEWFDLASFVTSFPEDRLSSKRGRRDLYNDILASVQELEREGFTVLSGIMEAPQEGLPDWKVAIISVTPKQCYPDALKRQYVMVDRRVVAMLNNKEAM
jgi:transcriptional regulator with XRE-family HTH domain